MATKKTTAKAATTVKSTRQSGKKAYGPQTVVALAESLGLDAVNRIDEYELVRPFEDAEGNVTWTSSGKRYGASCTVQMTPRLALELLILNEYNRNIKYQDTRKHASTMREGHWEPRTENLSIGIDLDTLKARLLDGQNRVLALIFAFGTREDCAYAMHILSTHRYNRENGTEYSPRKVYQAIESDYPEGEDIPDEMDFEEWYTYAVKNGWVKLPSEMSGWQYANDKALENHDWAPLPIFDLALGADPLVRLRADSDQSDRTASDFLEMDPEIGNELLREGISSDTTATLLNSIRLACTPAAYSVYSVNEKGEEVTEKKMGLGSLKKGGKGLQAGVCNWFLTFRDTILAEDKIWKVVEEVKKSFTGKAAERASDCQKSMALVNGIVIGNQIADLRIRQMIVLGLLAGHSTDDLTNWAIEARYGVKPSGKGYAVSNRFDKLREYMRALKAEKANPSADNVLRSLIAGTKAAKAEVVKDHNDLRGRFPGPDTDLLDEDTLKRTKGIDPNAKQGRPKGSKAKK